MLARRNDSGLKALLMAQFTGAFNDNAWKMIVTFLLMAGLSQTDGSTHSAQTITSLAFLVFTIPMIVFSLPAAFIADRVGKDQVVRAMKALEQVLMLAASAVLFVHPTGGIPALCVLGAMGAQSAIFSPAKYGIIPELVTKEKIVAANGALELATFAAIILGTGAGGLILEVTSGAPALAALGLAVFAGLGYRAALKLPQLPASAPADSNIRAQTDRALRAMRRDKALFRATLGSAAFWFLLSLLGQDILVYTKSDLQLSDGLASLPPALFGLGIGLGGVLAGRCARNSSPVGLVPIGAVLTSLVLGVFYLTAPDLPLTMLLAASVGLATGLVIVPLDSLIQARAPRRCRGAIIALGNVVVFTAMLLGSLAAAFMSSLGFTTLEILLLASGLSFLGSFGAFMILPAASLRTFFHLFFRFAHRAQFLGLENLPKHGPALICPNHVSFLDWAYIASMTDRPVRFLVEKSFFKPRISGFLLRRAGAIPITTTEGPRVLIQALKAARERLIAGELVCLFPEGEISRIGEILAFRRGFERLIENLDIPVIPVCLSGLEFSRFAPGKSSRMARVDALLRVGKVMKSPSPVELRTEVLKLASENECVLAGRLPLLHDLVLRQAKSSPRSRAYVAENGSSMSWQKAGAAALILAQELKKQQPKGERLAILLPPSPAAALANIATSLLGRVSVNLNFSAGPKAIESALRQSEMPLILTSRAVMERLQPHLPAEAELVFIEDLMTPIKTWRKLITLLLLRLLPLDSLSAWAGAARRQRPQDIATLIFSSGSTGEPKGIQLSHANVVWNARAALRCSDLDKNDVLAGCLPTFHSFGFMSLWLCAMAGMATAFQANPLDAVSMGRLVAREKATLLMATPSFLQLYLKRCEPGQFSSLRLVVVGAERLTNTLAQAFEERFGIRPLEGYGATECSPILAMSGPSFRGGSGVYQAAARAGSVGRPLVGVDLRIVDPESRSELGHGESGMIAVKGPNVMAGYLGQAKLNAEVIHEGFYFTGDMGRLDEDGFLFITDRLSRFSKIGGEMVAHGVVEDSLQEALGLSERRFAVVGLPDTKKGESLYVLHNLPGLHVDDLLQCLRERGLPNLFLPRADRFFAIPELPVLASGKLDLAALCREAESHREGAVEVVALESGLGQLER